MSASAKFSNLQRCDVIVGSAPECTDLADIDLGNFTVTAINNAWRVNPKFNYCIYPGDFPEDKRPPQNHPIQHVGGFQYNRHITKAGGVLFSGATMAICAGYFAIGGLYNPLIVFWACNMDYTPQPDDGNTHFYGKGRPDPLLKQASTYASIKNLRAKSHRMFLWGLLNNKVLVNLNPSPQANLILPHHQKDIDVERVVADKSLRPFLVRTIEILNLEKDFPISRFTMNLMPISRNPDLMA